MVLCLWIVNNKKIIHQYTVGAIKLWNGKQCARTKEVVKSDDVMVRSDFLQYPAYLTDPNGLVHREQQRRNFLIYDFSFVNN